MNQVIESPLVEEIDFQLSDFPVDIPESIDFELDTDSFILEIPHATNKTN